MKYSFETALVYLKRGYRIRRPDWDEKKYIYIHDGKVCYCRLGKSNEVTFIDGGIYNFENEDVLAEDWEVEE